MISKILNLKSCLILTLLFSLLGMKVPDVVSQGKEEWEISRWIDSQGREPTTYEEWKSKQPPTAPFKVGQPYKTWFPPPVKGFPAPPSAGKILLIVNSGIKESIQSSLDQYISDLEAEEYTVTVSTISGGTREDLRTYLQSELSGNLVGCVLIGDLPVPWFEIDSSEFPCDLFYMDLDGTWIDEDTKRKGVRVIFC